MAKKLSLGAHAKSVMIIRKIGHSLAFFITSEDYEKFRVQDMKQKHLNVISSMNSIPCTQVPQFTSPRQHLKVKRPLSLLPYTAPGNMLGTFSIPGEKTGGKEL